MALNCLVSTSLADESSMRDFIGGKTTFKDAGGSKIVARNRGNTKLYLLDGRRLD